MYRFRKIEKILGKHEELEKQEIYFSDITSLNDPLEGFRECFWSGDLVVWKNLLRHYLLCLEHVVILAYVKEELFTPEDIPVLDPEQFGESCIDLCPEAVIKFSKFSDHQVFQDRCDLVQSDHRINFETALQETCVGGGHHNSCQSGSGMDL